MRILSGAPRRSRAAGAARVGLVVLDADLDLVQFAAGDLGEEGEALDGDVRGGGQALVGLQPVRRLVLGEVTATRSAMTKRPPRMTVTIRSIRSARMVRCSPTLAVSWTRG
jgi:hypothetical protein